MHKVRIKFNENGKQRQKTIKTELPTDELGFVLFRTLDKIVATQVTGPVIWWQIIGENF